jgi:hypothetical protein
VTRSSSRPTPGTASSTGSSFRPASRSNRAGSPSGN